MESTRISLIHRVRDPADAGSWQEFVELYRPLLMSFAQNQGIGRTDADDVVQEILIALFRALQDFDFDPQRGRFRTYLYRATYNAFVDWLRRNKNRAGAEVAYDSMLAAVREDSGPEPDSQWIADLRRTVFSRASKDLRPSINDKTWRCFEQHLLKGRPAADVATEFGCSIGSVYTNAHRVLEKLRTHCREYYLEELADE